MLGLIVYPIAEVNGRIEAIHVKKARVDPFDAGHVRLIDIAQKNSLFDDLAIGLNPIEHKGVLHRIIEME